MMLQDVHILQSSPHPNPSLSLSLAADVPPSGVSAVISQQYPNGLERPTAFVYSTLMPSEKNCPQIVKEILALVFVLNVSVNTCTVGHFASSLTTSP